MLQLTTEDEIPISRDTTNRAVKYILNDNQFTKVIVTQTWHMSSYVEYVTQPSNWKVNFPLNIKRN